MSVATTTNALTNGTVRANEEYSPAAPSLRTGSKLLWIDPVNSDAQFLNVLGLALSKAGQKLTIRADIRNDFEPPAGLHYSSFSGFRKLPHSIEGNLKWRAVIGGLYAVNWFRAMRFAKSQEVHTTLVSSNLSLPRWDVFGLKTLRDNGITPVVLTHKPYPGFFADGNKRAERYREYYQLAEKILVMTHYSQQLLQALYRLPAEKFVRVPFPSYHELLTETNTDERLREALFAWAGGPVVSFLSSISNEHGLETFLASLPILKKLIPNVHLLVVSQAQPDTKRAIEHAIEDAEMTDRAYLRFNYYTSSELLAFLEVTAVVVLPYDFATQSGVIALAAGFGKPVVATSVGGLPEMVDPGRSGELVPPRDPEALARATARILNPATYPYYVRGSREHGGGALAPKKSASAILQCIRDVDPL